MTAKFRFNSGGNILQTTTENQWKTDQPTRLTAGRPVRNYSGTAVKKVVFGACSPERRGQFRSIFQPKGAEITRTRRRLKRINGTGQRLLSPGASVCFCAVSGRIPWQDGCKFLIYTQQTNHPPPDKTSIWLTCSSSDSSSSSWIVARVSFSTKEPNAAILNTAVGEFLSSNVSPASAFLNNLHASSLDNLAMRH